MKLVQVSINEHGVYFTYKIPVQRGIRGKSRGKVNELLIVGIPTNGVQGYCIRNNLIITNKAVYLNDLDNPILYRQKDTFNYIEKE